MKAEEVYVDPSALARLYLHQAASREMSLWRSRSQGALAVTHHGRSEVVNAICRAAFLGQLDSAGLAEALTDFESDFADGHLFQADILWRAALNGAAELSRRYTPSLGTRSLDVLHVACARELKLRHFCNFRHEPAATCGGGGFEAGSPVRAIGSIHTWVHFRSAGKFSE